MRLWGQTDAVGAGGEDAQRALGEQRAGAGSEGCQALSTQCPVVPATAGPIKDRHTFSINYVTTGQSQFPALQAGDFSLTVFQPEPPLWPDWRAATSSTSPIPGRCLWLPNWALKVSLPALALCWGGVKVHGGRGTGPGRPGGHPSLSPRSPGWGWEPCTLREQERAAAWRNPHHPPLGEGDAQLRGVGDGENV